jgi:dimethylhistidine N-methyltransferase
MSWAAERPAAGLCDPFADAVLTGLAAVRKSIPSRFLYDARGSELFERITELDEYYPTRTEIGLLSDHAEEMAALAGPGVALVEFGSGSSRKTDRLIEALPMLASYVPIDISEAALAGAVARLRATFPDLRVAPVHGDFARMPELPRSARAHRKLGFFPGSTIGNLAPAEARAFLAEAKAVLGARSGFIVGVDLKKDLGVLLPAYNDGQGITAAFNKNLLVRVNRELEGTLDLDAFAHEAIYNEAEGRIEMHLRSQTAQNAEVIGEPFHFEAGETIHTENSYKYTVEEFQALARSSGWEPVRVWTDRDELFSIHYLVPSV